MRVAVFTDTDVDQIAGVTTTLEAVLRWAPPDVSPRIYTASVLPVDQPDYLALAAAGLPIPFQTEARLYWPPWRELGRRIEAEGVDVLHLTTPGSLGLAALWVARQSALPLIGSVHGDLGSRTTTITGSPRLGRWAGSYERWIYQRCRTMLVPSMASRTVLIERGVSAHRIEMWPRGVDVESFRPELRSDALRDEWRVSDARPALLYVGRLSPEKGLVRLPALSDALSRAGLAHRLVFVGDGPLRRDLADRCPGALFLGWQRRERLATTFASADLFIYPGESSTAANVVLEAQAAGLPVVVSRRGGACEDLAINDSGFACDEPSSWHMAVSALVRDPQRRREMRQAARAFALGRRWELALRPLLDAYRSAAAWRGRPVSGAPQSGPAGAPRARVS